MGGKIRPGIIDDIGSTLDLFPTILSLSESKLDEEKIIDGFDIKETLFRGEPTQRDVIFYYRNREIFAVRYGVYKAHFKPKEPTTILDLIKRNTWMNHFYLI